MVKGNFPEIMNEAIKLHSDVWIMECDVLWLFTPNTSFPIFKICWHKLLAKLQITMISRALRII